MKTNRVSTDRVSPCHTWPHFLPPNNFYITQHPLKPISVFHSPSVLLSHQDDQDQEEKGPQGEAQDPRQGEDARNRIWVRSAP